MTDKPTSRTAYTLAVEMDGVIIVPSKPIHLVDCDPTECGVGEAVLVNKISVPLATTDARVPILGDGQYRTMTFARRTCAPEPASEVSRHRAIWVWERIE